MSDGGSSSPGDTTPEASPFVAGCNEASLVVPLARPIGVAKPIGIFRRQPSELLLQDISAKAAWRDLAVMVLALVVFEWLAVGLLASDSGVADQAGDGQPMQLPLTFLLEVVGGRALLVVVVIVALSYWQRLTSRSVGFIRRALVKNILLGVASLGVAEALIVVGQMFLQFTVPGFQERAVENARRITGMLSGVPVSGYALLFVVVAVYEELLFRGFLLPRLRRATGSWALAIVISTAVFILMHLSSQTAAAILPLLILSVTFCLTTIWRQSLVPAIVAHALFDLVNSLALRWMVGP